MDRLHATSNYENQLKSLLFQQLFFFQIELEQFNNDDFEHSARIQEIVKLMDELMESLLTEVNFE